MLRSISNRRPIRTNKLAHATRAVMETFENRRLLSATLTTLHNFTGGSDGATPSPFLSPDASGNLYGTTGYAFEQSEIVAGTAFELSGSSHQTFATLYDFVDGGSGAIQSSLVVDAGGNYYGTTFGDGQNTFGTVFELSGPDHSHYTALHTFTNGSDGGDPQGLLSDSSGNLYGLASDGGANKDGTAFELSGPNHTFSTLLSFNGSNGQDPSASLVADSSGNFYGTTQSGGAIGAGEVFKLSGSNHKTLAILHSFNGDDGAFPFGLLADASGNLYGAAVQGGNDDAGTIFKLSGSSHTSFSILHTFDGADGNIAVTTLIADNSGNLYGTTEAGGKHDDGTVFKLSGSGYAVPKLTVSAPSSQSSVTNQSKALSLGSFSISGGSGPYTVDVDWGDGSADNKFLQPATGTIIGQNHSFDATGTYSVKVVVTNGQGFHSSATFKVTVTSNASISGSVFNDANNNGKQDSGEPALGGWEVYLDTNKNGKLDNGEPTAFTNSSGAYTFTPLTTGSYTVRLVTPSNWTQTSPSGGSAHSVTLSTGQKTTGENFGVHTAVKYLSTVASTSGIVAWWTFGSSSQANSILNGYTGSLKGGATIGSSGSGAPISGESSNSGLVLNGTSAYVDTNLTTQQEFAPAATYNVWINLGAFPASGKFATILAKSEFGDDLDVYAQSDGSIDFYTDNGTSTVYTPPSLSGWHMVTVEVDTAAKIRKIFWDGQLAAQTNPYTGSHFANSGTFSIGESDVFTGRFFDGSIDEATLWNRALTAAEITAIYKAATG